MFCLPPCVPGLALALLLFTPGAWSSSTSTLGWLEWGYLVPQGIRMKTKLDTGAKTSSLDAADIVPFEVDGQRYVRFRVPVTSRPEDFDVPADFVLERPVERDVIVKKHRGKNEHRYVVELEFCIAGEHFTTPVSLANRSRFNYPLLLGRAALAGRTLVDPARTFSADKGCKPGKKKRTRVRAEETVE